MKSVKTFLKKALTYVLGILLTVGLLPVDLASAAKPTKFDHIDIRSAASFIYNVDGADQTVNLDFYQNTGQLSNIKLYRRNQNGTNTSIPVSGGWRQDDLSAMSAIMKATVTENALGIAATIVGLMTMMTLIGAVRFTKWW